MREEDIEAMSQIFEEYGIKKESEIIKKITSDFIDHISNMQDISNIRFIEHKKGKCSNCIILESKINELEAKKCGE